MSSFVEYIKKHAGDKFDIVNCFHEVGIIDQTIAEKQFKKAMHKAATWKPSRAQQWALEQTQSNFAILKQRKLSEYWQGVLKAESQSKELSANLQYQGQNIDARRSTASTAGCSLSKRKLPDTLELPVTNESSSGST